ncbi:MAG: hypothetical protein ABIR10_10715 [Dokdonella sp.]
MPAIVVGRGATALGILRCLRLAGLPAYVACPAGDQVTHSRWYRPLPGTAPWDGTIGLQGCGSLSNLPLPEAVLIPGADDAALWLTDLPQSELGDRFKVSTSSRQTQEILQDKSRFAAFLENTDIPHPPTYLIESTADIDAIPFEQLDRVFIKPVNSQKFSDTLGVKGIWVKRKEELLAAWQNLRGHGFKLMAQEYVPGTPADHYFVDGFRDAHGRLTGLFTRQRIRISPPDFGNSSYSRSIPVNDVPAPVASVTSLLSKLNYRGIFSAEFKRDARDGQFRILEVNTRAWTYVEFAARCGVNVCEMAYQDAMGLPVNVASRDYAAGAGCVDLYRDLSSVLAQGAPRRGSLPTILQQWASAHYHSFRIDDPSPGLFVARDVVMRRLKQYFER